MKLPELYNLMVILAIVFYGLLFWDMLDAWRNKAWPRLLLADLLFAVVYTFFFVIAVSTYATYGH